jgi:protein gp37
METRMGRVQWGGPGLGAGTRDRTSEANWRKPIAWNKKAKADGAWPFVFCSSLADVFDNEVPTEWRRDLFELIIETPNLIWLLLTKRPQNIVKMFDQISHVRDEWPRNAAIGTTIEDQKRFDLNAPALRKAKRLLNPAFAFLSCEPLLGPIDGMLHEIDWVIVGGETDQGEHKARPSHPEWFRELRDQCAAAGVAFHLKQWGEWTPGENVPASVRGKRPSAHFTAGDGWFESVTNMSDPEDGWDDEPDVYRIGKKLTGRLLDGVQHDARPEVRA